MKEIIKETDSNIKTESNTIKTSERNSINNKKNIKKNTSYLTKKNKINRNLVLILIIIFIYLVFLIICLYFFVVKKGKNKNDNYHNISTYFTDDISNSFTNEFTNDITNNLTNDLSENFTNIISSNYISDYISDILDCGSGYFLTDNNKTCQKCSINNCEKCYERNNTNVCIFCMSDFIPIYENGIIKSCRYHCEIGKDEKCFSCDSNNINCSSCNAGYKLSNGKCILNYSFKVVYQIKNESEKIRLI